MSVPDSNADRSPSSPDRCARIRLDLRVVRHEQRLVLRPRDERAADLPAELARIGMFCRLGFVEDRRPVAAPSG